MIPFVITGDTHGEHGRMAEIISHMRKYADMKEKYICVAGDFGYLYKDDFGEHKFLNEMEKQDFIFVVVPGNHENYDAFRKYEVVNFHGARAHRIRKNIFYVCRGEIFKIGNKSFFTMSGGYSVDGYMRRKGVSLWEAEMPTDAEYRHATENLEAYRKKGGKIDYVISHTASLSGLEYLHASHGREEYPLNNFLEYVRELLAEECEMFFFGHLHIDREMPSIKHRALSVDYVTLDLEEK